MVDLFKTRGWQTIIADNIVSRLLVIISLTIGLLTGVLTLFAALFVEEFEANEGMQGWLAIGFFIGIFIGLILSGVFMGLILSAVDAVIVCYAEVRVLFWLLQRLYHRIECILIFFSKYLILRRLPMNCKSSTLRLQKRCLRLGQKHGGS